MRTDFSRQSNDVRGLICIPGTAGFRPLKESSQAFQTAVWCNLDEGSFRRVELSTLAECRVIPVCTNLR